MGELSRAEGGDKQDGEQTSRRSTSTAAEALRGGVYGGNERSRTERESQVDADELLPGKKGHRDKVKWRGKSGGGKGGRRAGGENAASRAEEKEEQGGGGVPGKYSTQAGAAMDAGAAQTRAPGKADAQARQERAELLWERLCRKGTGVDAARASPQDVQFTVQEASDAIRQGCVAAFSSDEKGGDGVLVVVFEIRQERESEARAVVEAAQAALSSFFGLRAAKVVAIRQKTIPKTTSGKIRRGATRQALHDGTLHKVHELIAADTVGVKNADTSPSVTAEVALQPPPQAGENVLKRTASHTAMLLGRAQEVATELDDKLFAFWYDGKGKQTEQYSFKRMWDEAGKIAYMLREEWGVPKGSMVVLCYGPGLHFFAAFLGCLRAGVVAVMVYPPAPPLSKSLPKMSKIVADCKPLLCLTDSKIAALRKVDRANPLSDSSKLWPEALDFKATDGGLLQSFFSSSTSSSSARSFDEPGVTEEDLAFLQYTSGSTGDPKGVMVTFGALMANVYLIGCHPATGMVHLWPSDKKAGDSSSHQSEASYSGPTTEVAPTSRRIHNLPAIGFSWLPQYHDMGLVLGLLTPFLTGMTMHYMSPVSFIKRPLLWLELVSRHRVEWSVAPDFAYALCARYMAKIRGTRKEPKLDLSFVVTLTSGAEPIRTETVERFEGAFLPFGLRQGWFSAAYGLAEHVVSVSWATVPDRSPSRPDLTSVGSPSERADFMDIRIVDTDTMVEVHEAGAVGEIWVCSPSVAAGYWGKPELSKEVFRAELSLRDRAASSREYLRTGDLGFVEEGLLYMCGRIKDLIIFNGVNHYPQDVEFAVQEASDAIRQGCVAAFSSDETGGDGVLEVVFEIRQERESETRAVVEAAQAMLSSSFGLKAARVMAIKQKTIPKTTSGKIRRRATRQALHADELHTVYELTAETVASGGDGAVDSTNPSDGPLRNIPALMQAKTVDRSSSSTEHAADGMPVMKEGIEGVVKAARVAFILERVVDSAREASGNPGLRATDRFMDAGITSEGLAGLAQTLEDLLYSSAADGRALDIEATAFFDFPTPALLAAHLHEALYGDERSASGTDSISAPLQLEAEAAGDRDIAVIGMSCRFPGGCNSPEELWVKLCSEQDCVSEAPPERGLGAGIQGGFIDGVDKFDNAFFSISLAEAEALDPSQRIMLETAYEALYRAGFDKGLESLHGLDIGVFIGKSGAEWNVLQQESGAKQSAYSLVGGSAACVAGRISHTLGLTGNCQTIDTGCPSALVALDTACNNLVLGKCSGAVVGGVNLLLHRQTFGALDKAGLLSKLGRCKSLDATADGYVRAEGCGALVLKRSADAKLNGDRILATIKATAVSHSGVSSSLSAPKGVAQKSVATAALSRAGYRGSDVSYVEAHATATVTGDAIEMGALKAVYAGLRPPQSPLVVGTVKTTLGHMEGASGMAQLIKAILVLEHGAAPPNLHLEEVNPMLKLEGLPVVLPTQMTDLAACCSDEEGLVAGVNSFGLGGFNAHCILQGQVPATDALAQHFAMAAAKPQRRAWTGYQTRRSFPLPRALAARAAGASTEPLGAPGRMGELLAVSPLEREASVRHIVMSAVESVSGATGGAFATDPDPNVLEAVAYDSVAVTEVVTRVVDAIEGDEGDERAGGEGRDESLRSIITPAAVFDMPTLNALSSFISEACVTLGEGTARVDAQEKPSPSGVASSVSNADREWQHASDAHMPAHRKAELGYTAFRLATAAAAQGLAWLAIMFVVIVLLGKVSLSVGTAVSGFPLINLFQVLKLLELQEGLASTGTRRDALVTSDYLAILLGNLVGLVVTAALALLTAPLVKWSIVGTYQAGVYKVYSTYHLRCWVVETYLDYFFHPLVGIALSDSVVLVPLYRMMGAHIGDGCDLTGVRLSEFDLVHIGDNCLVSDSVMISPKTLIGDMRISYDKVVIGSGCDLGAVSSVHGGARLEDNVTIGVKATVPSGTRLAGARLYEGNPAAIRIPPKQPPIRGPALASKGWMQLMLLGTCLAITLLPGFLAAIAFQLEASNKVSAGRYTGILLLFLWLAIISTTAVIVGVVLKWVLVGKLSKGRQMNDMSTCALARRETANRLTGLSHLLVMSFFSGTELMVLWYKLLGASISWSASIGGAVVLSDPDTLDIGANAFLGSGLTLHTESSGTGVLLGCSVGEGATLGDKTIIGAGASLGRRALITSCSCVPEGAEVPEGAIMTGLPARVSPATTYNRGKGREKVKKSEHHGAGADEEEQGWRARGGRRLGMRTLLSMLVVAVHVARLFCCAIVPYEFLHLFQQPITDFYASGDVGLDRPQIAIWSRFDTQTLLLPVALLLFHVAEVCSSIAFKKVFGRTREASFSRESGRGDAYFMYLLLESLGSARLAWTLGTPLYPLFVRLMGASVSMSAYIESRWNTELELITIGEGVMVSRGVTISPHSIQLGEVELRPIKVGHSVVLGRESRLVGGGIVKPGSIVGDNSRPSRGQVIRPPSSRAGSTAGAGTWHFAGVPIAPFKQTPYLAC